MNGVPNGRVVKFVHPERNRARMAPWRATAPVQHAVEVDRATSTSVRLARAPTQVHGTTPAPRVRRYYNISGGGRRLLGGFLAAGCVLCVL